MPETPIPENVSDLEKFFRGRVRGPEDRWVVAWAALRNRAEENWQYAQTSPAEWPDDVDAIERDLRAGINAGQVLPEPPRPGVDGLVPARVSDSASLEAHNSARDYVMAEHAAEAPAVRAFRGRWLSHHLATTSDEVAAWFDQHAGNLPIEWVDLQGKTREAMLDKKPAEDLLGAVGELLRNYPWEAPQAVSFTLTGATPVTSMMRLSSRQSGGTTTARNERGEIVTVELAGLPSGDARDLVTIEVHPTVAASVVAEEYLRVQREVFGIARAHPVGERVGEAVAASIAVPGGPAVQNAQLTNPYKNADQFRRIVSRAKPKLLQRARPWPPAEDRRSEHEAAEARERARQKRLSEQEMG